MSWNDATVSRYRRLPAFRTLDLDFKELDACFVVTDAPNKSSPMFLEPISKLLTGRDAL